MKEHYIEHERYRMMRIMTWIAIGITVAIVALRAWLLPSVRDWETGLFTPNNYVMIFTVVGLLAMAVLGYLFAGTRHEIFGTGCKMMAVALLLCGVVMIGTEGYAGYGSMLNLRDVAQIEGQPLLTPALLVAQNVFGVLGGIAFILLGLRMLSEGVTRRGISQWSALLPVAWVWLRLVNYEVSYASMVRLSDSFFGLLMVIFELVFVFKLARYVSGVGRMRTGVMGFYAMATAVFALSAPVVRLIMFLMGDSTAFEAHDLAGVSDFTVGLVALAMGISLLNAQLKAYQEAAAAAPQRGMVDAGDLLTVDADAEA